LNITFKVVITMTSVAFLGVLTESKVLVEHSLRITVLTESKVLVEHSLRITVLTESNVLVEHSLRITVLTTINSLNRPRADMNHGSFEFLSQLHVHIFKRASLVMRANKIGLKPSAQSYFYDVDSAS
jgi:hypothetical protein